MNYTANIDTAEVAKFSAMAEHWWEPSGPCAPLHIINPCRVQFVHQRAKLAHKNILDVGCGAGILTESLAQHGAHVIGIDAGCDVISAAQAHAALKDIPVTYEVTTIEDFLPAHIEQFDIITCMELIEHVPDPGKLMADCAQMLKPGGQLFISTINRTPKSYVLAILGAEYVLKMLPRRTHDYKKFIRPAELAAMLKTEKMQLQDLKGIKFDPFTKTAKLQDDLSVNYLAHAIKEI